MSHVTPHKQPCAYHGSGLDVISMRLSVNPPSLPPLTVQGNQTPVSNNYPGYSDLYIAGEGGKS